MEDKKEKLLNLLADEALFGLSEAESAELSELKKEFPEFAEDRSFELAASAVNLTNLKTDEQMPAHLQAKILSNAEEFFPPQPEKQPNVLNFAQPVPAVESARSAVETSPTPWWNWLGWGLAAAAGLALAINLWMTRVQPQEPIVLNPPTQTPTPVQPNPRREREKLLASAQDLVRSSWAEPDPKAAKQISGDIVWSNAEQKGYMRFQGLPANDPKKETYQLWIFDENQSDKYPIDGGVFDVSETGETIVPIDPKIAVKKPQMFAITIEKPGGVVVSDRQRLILIGKV